MSATMPRTKSIPITVHTNALARSGILEAINNAAPITPTSSPNVTQVSTKNLAVASPADARANTSVETMTRIGARTKAFMTNCRR